MKFYVSTAQPPPHYPQDKRKGLWHDSQYFMLHPSIENAVPPHTEFEELHVLLRAEERTGAVPTPVCLADPPLVPPML